MKKFSLGRPGFIMECLHNARPAFPKNNNLQLHFIYSSYVARILERKMHFLGITDLNDLNQYPELQKDYRELETIEAIIKKLGYTDVPAGIYEEMLKQEEFKGEIQRDKNISGKVKHNQFKTVN